MKLDLLILSIVVLFLIASCTSQQTAKTVTYVVEEKQPVVFVVEQEDPLSWLQETNDKRVELNTIRALRDFEDDEEEYGIKSKLNNVRRFIDGEMIIGFDEDLDNPDFKEVDNNY